jgi:hypothetical protein
MESMRPEEVRQEVLDREGLQPPVRSLTATRQAAKKAGKFSESYPGDNIS